MFSTFLVHARNRRQEEGNAETPPDSDLQNADYSTESASTIRRARRSAGSRENAIVSGSGVGPSGRRPKLDQRGQSHAASTSTFASTSTPNSGSSVTITNPIKVAPDSVEYGSGRRNLTGVNSREEDEMKPRSNPRRRSLYPPSRRGTGTSKSQNLSENENEAMPTYERPQSRAEHRPGYELSYGPLPSVVRLDSTSAEDNEDNSPEFETQGTRGNAGRPNHSYPDAKADNRVASNTHLPKGHSSRDNPLAQRQARPPRPPKSQKRQMHPYSQRWAQGSQSNQSLSESRPSASGNLALPYDQTRSETQSHSEADFYASALEDLEVETDGSISDYNSDNNGSPFASVLDSFPLPTRSVTSTTSSSRSGSGISSPASGGGVGSMTKNRWNLKVQVQQLQMQRGSQVGGTSGSGSGGATYLSRGDIVGGGKSSSILNLTEQQQPESISNTVPAPSSSSMVQSGDVDPSDIYRIPPGYNYPYAHPSSKLSPIAEQDYKSPSPHSSREGSRSFKNWRGSESIREKGNVLISSVEKSGNLDESHIEGDDRVSIKTSIRTGSVGSTSGAMMSRTGSGSAADGSGIHSKLGSGTDAHRPFITRHVNRTVSQTSSKSWSESVVGQPTPSTAHSSAQPSPRIEGLVPAHLQSLGRTITTHLPASRLGGGNRNAVEPVQSPSPNSMSGTTYSPTSTLQQSLNGTSALQPPAGAIVATTPPVPTSHGNPTPPGSEVTAVGLLKLPSVGPPLDLRFSMLESVAAKNSRRVDKMPIIPGSVEGHREDEYEEYDEQYDQHSLHADSFVTAGDVEKGDGVELDTMSEAREDSFIDRRWERDADLGTGAPMSSYDSPIFLAKSTSTLTPAFWSFWLGFFFPVLWLAGGWLFTNIGEMPPKYTAWEWFFWKRGWRPKRLLKVIQNGLLACFRPRPTRMLRRANSSVSNAKVRSGKIYPALPRWVAEKQTTDDGRMKLNDPKQTLRGIQFGYPFIPRLDTGHYMRSPTRRIFTAPNRVLDQLYGVQAREVRGRPETSRRMLDPWIQRCRYAFCYFLLLLAIGLCIASIYLIIFNTRNLR